MAICALPKGCVTRALRDILLMQGATAGFMLMGKWAWASQVVGDQRCILCGSMADVVAVVMLVPRRGEMFEGEEQRDVVVCEACVEREVLRGL